MFVEFAIALPLLILLMCGLAAVGLQTFKLGKDQLADYVLEAEARYVMERITQDARVAKEIYVDNDSDEIKIIFYDTTEPQFYYPYKAKERPSKDLYSQRQNKTYPRSPITGNNFFGDTKINSLQFSELNENVLRIEFEMQSLVTRHKIKIATAVFVPGCEKLEIKPHE